MRDHQRTTNAQLDIAPKFSRFIRQRTLNLSTASPFYRFHCEEGAIVAQEHLLRDEELYTCSEELFRRVLKLLRVATLDQGVSLLVSAGLRCGDDHVPADILATALYEAVRRFKNPARLADKDSRTPFQVPSANELIREQLAVAYQAVFNVKGAGLLDCVVSKTSPNVWPPRISIDLRGEGVAELIIAMQRMNLKLLSLSAPVAENLQGERYRDNDHEEITSALLTGLSKELEYACGLTQRRRGQPATGKGAAALYLKLNGGHSWGQIAKRLCEQNHKHDDKCAKNFENQAKAYKRKVRDGLRTAWNNPHFRVGN